VLIMGISEDCPIPRNPIGHSYPSQRFSSWNLKFAVMLEKLTKQIGRNCLLSQHREIIN